MKDTLSRMNQALIGMLFGFFRKRNFGKMLTAIENHIRLPRSCDKRRFENED